jgi:hypothetical protein
MTTQTLSRVLCDTIHVRMRNKRCGPLQWGHLLVVSFEAAVECHRTAGHGTGCCCSLYVTVLPLHLKGLTAPTVESPRRRIQMNSLSQASRRPTMSVWVQQDWSPSIIISDRDPATWRVRALCLYSPETGWPSYTFRHWVSISSPPTARRVW